jgi:formylglycine-generating enzyme required for sulfatase activity/nitrate/TMAO reductase-like tetraheme cytochrome c subunit
MKGKLGNFLKKRITLILFIGFIIGLVITILGQKAIKATSTDAFCKSCHVHPHSTQTWKLSTHYDNERGIVVHCVECHLPPKGDFHYLAEKAKTGARDVYGVIFKDVEKLNWEEKSTTEAAKKHVYEESCKACHENLFPKNLTKEGEDAHLHFTSHDDELHCVNCHLHVGHYEEGAGHTQNINFGKTLEPQIDTVYNAAATIERFENFTEYIPGTDVKFDMVAIDGGKYEIGSPADEPFREEDEDPQAEIEISPFFMGEVEVTWDEYLTFFKETGSEGRIDYEKITDFEDVDAITGPTPPYGSPDQGWGQGNRPAITMTHYAATVYCEWLSRKTGKKYRLPTEAEWEYAARGGTTTPYFFEGNPKDYSDKVFWNRIFGIDTTNINTYVIYKENSDGKTGYPSDVAPNPFGLKNMLGNVSEFCSDWYSPDIYEQYDNQSVKNPTGPLTGEEHVIRGGSYNQGAGEVRSASRDYTRTETWLKTDPQIPKSIWWYSDVSHVGFRVVCEFDENTLIK